MIAAVALIHHSLGEDPLRKEFVGMPYHHVQWLMNFKRSNLEMKSNCSSLSRICLHNMPCANGNQGRQELHSELKLPFCSQFQGVIHVGYCDEEEGRVIERSVLQSLFHFYSCKLQVQERLTGQIAVSVHSVLSWGVMVAVEANHICMIARGIDKVRSSTATVAVMGQFSTNQAVKKMFLQTISKPTASGG